MADTLIVFRTGLTPVCANGTFQGDRGCVDCRRTIDISPAGSTMLLCDDRGRYWCLTCAAQALGNVRRRVDERDDYDYPWRFDEVGPDGERLERASAPRVSEPSRDLKQTMPGMRLRR